MEIVLLSQHSDLILECANLLNTEWKRSTSARVQSLEKSVLELPDSLLLLEITENGKKVIGHSRLTRVLEDPCGCWIGSVVISAEKRKKGYGKYLMLKSEEYAKALQYSTAYLNTRDQQGFYEHLGYTYCDPVSSISSSLNGYISRSIVISNEKPNQNMITSIQSLDNQNCTNDVFDQQSLLSGEKITALSPPPPPPPPPSQPASHNFKLNENVMTNLGQFWMKKKL